MALNFEITRDPWNLYICESGYGSLGYEGFHDWKILQARYALCLLFEYVATLGLLMWPIFRRTTPGWIIAIFGAPTICRS